MTSYDYPNARIRGLRGKLLRPGELDALAAQSSLSDFAEALRRTDYARDLDRAAEHLSGLAAAEEALQRNLAHRLQNLLGFFQPDRASGPSHARRLLRVLLSLHDVANLVALLRGRAAGAAPDDVRAALLPAGALDGGQLAVLARAPTMEACVAQLQAWAVPYAPALAVAARTFQRDGRLGALELALRRGYLQWAGMELQGRDPNVALVRETLKLETDAANLIAVLRLAHRGTRLETDQIASLLLPGGDLPVQRLTALASSSSLAEATDALADMPLGRALAAARPSRSVRDEAVALELAAEGYVLRWTQAQVYRDPLGIGVAVAYHAAKVGEVRRLRLIARSLHARWPRPLTRELLAS
jgi:V/A-type H+-transporting ATPase subunit C